MKKLFLSIIILAAVTIFAANARAIITYNCTAWTGGTDRALDSISVDDLSDGARAIVFYASGTSTYLGLAEYDASGTTAENVSVHPYFVRPDDYSTGGVWCEIPASWVDLLTSLTIADLTVTGTNTVVNLDASGRLTGALVVTDINTGTVTLSGVSQRGGLVTNLNAASEVTAVFSSATKGDSAIVYLAKDMISGSTLWIQFNSADKIINYSDFVTGTVAGTSYYYLSDDTTSGLTGEGISLISPADGFWIVYENESPTAGSIE